MLIERIHEGRTPVTYGEVAHRTARIANGLGPLLDGLEYDCAARGEPNLAVLVVNQDSGEPTKYARRGDDWRSEQQRCHRHTWQSGDGPASRPRASAAATSAPMTMMICFTCYLAKSVTGICPNCDD